MANDYYTRAKTFSTGTKAKGSDVVSELDLIVAGLDKLPSQARMDGGNPNYVVAGGTADALTITSPGTAITTYTGQDGLAFSVKATATNTGATTINVDGAGAVSLVASDGSTPAAGSITANGIYSVVYNETTGNFVFSDPLGSEAAASASAAAAAASETAAAASAAGVNLPAIESGDALKHLRANAGETGFELQAVVVTSIDYQEFTSSGTWTKPANALSIYVECVGGGGGGSNGTTNTTSVYASGGGGGGFSDKEFLASDTSATETVTIGAGGNGAANASNTIGSAGGDTTFGSLLTGRGAPAMLSVQNGGTSGGGQQPDMSKTSRSAGGYSGGAGGAASISDIERSSGGNSIKGGAGGGGTKGTYAIGLGGTSVDGGAGGDSNQSSSTKGGNGAVPGGGGGGSTNDGGGGDGADGRVRVWTTIGG
mgnify:CR=1 FL=1